ncbi:hypothetical protein P1J78_18915 [Psychromarinibacter sp. C21-152]|uniref:KTSC domain-containing protein n=1 Tax=Psychromarinibacter sediminicola TaxID=3033385 RepID=A0AAE3NVC9_9RHOB|nr:hypothetical protein [Psychromarinibacter sediminicola]MDF0602817.1 hypothetical protein [Psychromarinibacter sediminicola]
MKSLALVAVLAATLSAPAFAGGRYYTYTYGQGTVIQVSCYRGPWTEVIWDRPNPVFIDTLVAAGYDYPTAHAIGERVCRDPALVNNPAGLRAEMTRIYRSAPVYRY